MVELAQNHKLSQKGEELQSNRAKPAWQRPSLTLLGRVRDLVKGGGKSGWKDDADPQDTFNPGRVPPGWPPWG